MNRLALALLLIAVTLTRLPLLWHGYGTDPDAWRVASAAHRLWTTGTYEVSRYPGYPLHELVSAPLAGPGGAAASNGATLVVALLLIVVWNRMTLREAHHPALLVLTLALTPLFLRNSATTMDYVWSMFFVLLALDRALCGRALVAGALMGVAAGFRLSNLVALVPVGVALLDQIPGRPVDHRFLRSARDHMSIPSRAVLQSALGVGTALAVTIVCYSPVLLTVGLERWYAETAAQLASVREHNELGLHMFLYRGVYAFGPLAVAAAALLPGVRWGELGRHLRENDPVFRSAVAAHAAYGLLFLSLPLEREYLLPLLPFSLLLMDRFLTRGKLFLLMLFVISYGFMNPDVVSHDGPVGRIRPHLRAGLLLEEWERREGIAATRREILGLKEAEKTLVVTGFPEPYWFDEAGVERIGSPFHEQLFRNRAPGRTTHIFSLSPAESTLARSLGFSILPLREAQRDTAR